MTTTDAMVCEWVTEALAVDAVWALATEALVAEARRVFGY